MHERAQSSWWRGFLLVAVILSVVGALWICRQPLIEDEVEFAEIARSYGSTGLPLAHVSGEIAPVAHHPQLYHLLLAVFSIAGGPEWGGRLFGLLCLFGSALLAAELARQLWQESSAGEAAAIMVLLCPLCFRGALLLDIDNTVLPLVCLGFLAASMRDGAWRNRAQVVLSTVLFAAALWIKLVTPLFLLIPLWIMWGRERWRDFLRVVLGGVILFAVSWVAFCWAKGLDSLDPLQHLLGKAFDAFQPGLGNIAWELIKRLLRIVLWISPLLIGLLLARQSQPRSKRMLAALGSFVIVNLSFYWIVGGDAFGFPRYQVPAASIIMILLAPALVAGWAVIGGSLWIKGALFVGSVVLLRIVAGDVLFPIYTYPERTSLGMVSGEDLLRSLLWMVVPVVAVGALIAVIWRHRWGSVRLWISAICAMMLLPWWISQSLSMASASYNTGYLYGESGIKQAATLLTTFVPEEAQIVVSKDVAYHTGYRSPHRVLGSVCQNNDLAAVLKDPQVQALVYRHGQWIDAVTGPCLQSETVQRELHEAFYPFQTGSFQIWIKRRNLGFQDEGKP